MSNKHKCEAGLPFGRYGSAIDNCYENENGELWIGNGEYESRVNFCPYCGFKAKNSVFCVNPVEGDKQ